jgi:O-antigen/teichoic acid export membrane protein
MISKSFLQSSFIYTFIGALPLASAIVLLPFYTYFLNTTQFGQIALYISFTLLMQVIVGFSFDQAVLVHYHDHPKGSSELKKLLGTIFSGQLGIGVILILVSLFAGTISFQIIFGKNALAFFPYGFMAVVTALFNSYFKTYCNLLISQQKPIKYFWASIFNFVLTIAISLVGLYLYPHTLAGPMWGRLLSGAGIFVWAAIDAGSEFGFHYEQKIFKILLPFCIPFILFNILNWILSYIDRYIINDYINTSNVGIYDFAVKCTIFIDFLQSGLAYSIQPKIFSQWKEKGANFSNKEFNKYYSAFTGINVMLIPLLILIVPIIVPLVVKKQEYYAAFQYVPVLCMGYLFRAMIYMFQAPVLYQKKTKILPQVFFISAIFQVLLSIIFIREWGLWGIVWAAFISKLLQQVFLFASSKRIYSFSFNIVKFIVLPVVVSATIWFFEKMNSLNLNLRHFIVVIFASILTVLIYRNELKKLYFSTIKIYFSK